MQDQWGMSNVLKVSLQETICTLDGRGWSRRRIARELGINRETVGRYLLLAKPAISTAGVEGTSEAKPAISIAGKSVGRKSQCEPLAEAIMAKVEVGLSAQRIYQDLVEESGFTDSYQSVKRFVTVPPQIVHGYLSIGISPIFYAVIFIFKGKTCCRNKRRQQEP